MFALVDVSSQKKRNHLLFEPFERLTLSQAWWHRRIMSSRPGGLYTAKLCLKQTTTTITNMGPSLNYNILNHKVMFCGKILLETIKINTGLDSNLHFLTEMVISVGNQCQ
jgi:hypothetical protein